MQVKGHTQIAGVATYGNLDGFFIPHTTNPVFLLDQYQTTQLRDCEDYIIVNNQTMHT